eukprot:XP_014775575.1 PREDICTED: uncharacterized protein LOC106872914 [Octopus bimaculoides]
MEQHPVTPIVCMTETPMNPHINSTRVRAPVSDILDVQASCIKTDKGTSLNPTGRQVADSKNRGIKLMNSKKYLQIGTLNVRTLKEKEKRLEMANNFNKCKLNILGVVEHKVEEDPSLIEQLEGYTLITTGAWRNTNGAAAGGVGLIINSLAEKALAEIIPANDRIVTATFNGNPSTSVVINCAPIEGSKDAEETLLMTWHY